MSLLAVLALAAPAAALQPSHTVQLEHRGSTYRVDYRPQVRTSLRTIGMASGTRPSTLRCVVSADVAVERVVAEKAGRAELKSVLPGTERYTQQLPGDCHGREGQGTKLVQGKAHAVSQHLARTARADAQAALAAIESAHHFASN